MDQSTATHRRASTVFLLLTTAAYGLFFAAVAVSVLFTRLNFDEGYNLQAPLNLIRSGVYGSRTAAGFTPFDPYISAGPAFLLPVAGSLLLFGAEITPARAAAALYALLAAGLVLSLSRRGKGWGAAAVSGACLLGVRGLPYTLGTVMGEGAGVALVLAGIAMWRRQETICRRNETMNALRPALLAGLLWGLSVWAKPSMIMAVFFLGAVLALAGLLHAAGSRRGGNSPAPATAVAVPPAAALAAAAIAAGVGLLWFLTVAIFSHSAGAAIPGSPAPGVPSSLFQDQFSLHWVRNLRANLPVLAGGIGAGVLLGVILLAAALISARWAIRAVTTPSGMGIPTGMKMPTGTEMPEVTQAPVTDLLLLALPLGWILWWALFNASANPRHLMPGLVFGIPAAARYLTTGARGWRPAVLRGAVALALLAGALPGWTYTASALSGVESGRQGRQEQADFAAAVRGLEEDARLAGWGWFMPWDVAFLTGRTFENLKTVRAAPTAADLYLVITPTLHSFPRSYQQVRKAIQPCVQGVVVQSGEFELVKMKRGCGMEGE